MDKRLAREHNIQDREELPKDNLNIASRSPLCGDLCGTANQYDAFVNGCCCRGRRRPGVRSSIQILEHYYYILEEFWGDIFHCLLFLPLLLRQRTFTSPHPPLCRIDDGRNLYEIDTELPSSSASYSLQSIGGGPLIIGNEDDDLFP